MIRPLLTEMIEPQHEFVLDTGLPETGDKALRGKDAGVVDIDEVYELPLELVESIHEVAPPALNAAVTHIWSRDRRLRPAADLDLRVAYLERQLPRSNPVNQRLTSSAFSLAIDLRLGSRKSPVAQRPRPSHASACH